MTHTWVRMKICVLNYVEEFWLNLLNFFGKGGIEVGVLVGSFVFLILIKIPNRK